MQSVRGRRRGRQTRLLGRRWLGRGLVLRRRSVGRRVGGGAFEGGASRRPSPPLSTSFSLGVKPPTDVSNIVLYLCAGGDDWETGLLAQARGEEEGGAGDAAAAASTSAADAALAARGRAIFEAITSSGPLPAKEGEMASTFLGLAKKGVSKGAKPDLVRFGPLPRNFKGAVQLPELKDEWARELRERQ